MSDREFDNYLALLAKLLRLGDKQRAAIAGELRAHLEDRLDELLARGVPRDEAVQRALEEFGDAAALASEFASVSKSRKRRWMMRLTTASVAATVLIAATIFTFWPGTNAGPGPAATVAQDPEGTPAGAPARPRAVQKLTLEDKLNRRLDAEFIETPLRDAIEFLRAQADIQVVIKTKMLEESGVSVDSPVTISLKDVRLSTLLDLVLEEAELAYSQKDELLVITTNEDEAATHQVRVYDCRALLELPRPPGSVGGKGLVGRGGFFAVQDEPATKAPADADDRSVAPAIGSSPDNGRQVAQDKGAGGAAGGEGAGLFFSELSDAENLMQVIKTTIDPECWGDAGGPASIAEYKGLLTVAATRDVHDQVERLLNMLHEAAGLKERVAVVR